MGQKLNLFESEEFFEDEELDVEGVTGACYCCGEHIFMSFRGLSTLPFMEINGNIFYVFLCEFCEDDIETLKWKGIERVSYDILWVIQEELNDELLKLKNEEKKTPTQDNRKDLLFNVYKKIDKKVKEEISDSYLRQLTKDKKFGNS